LLSAGNANPLHNGGFTDISFKLFRGKGVINARSTRIQGDVIIEAKSKNMESGNKIILQSVYF